MCYIFENKLCKLKREYADWSSRHMLKTELIKFTGKQQNVQQRSHSFLSLLILICQEIDEVTLKLNCMWCKIPILNYETAMTVIVFYFHFIAS